jgi:hypothetical protein
MSLQRTVRTRTSDSYRGIKDFKRSYQPKNNLMKDENGDLLADSQNILNRWKNCFSQLLNVHNVSDEKTKCVLLSRHQNAGQNRDIKIV